MSFWRKRVIQPALDSAEDAAVREQQELLLKDPSNSKTYFALGVLAHLRGRPGEAISHFLKATDLDPRDPLPLVNLGRILAVQGDSETAWKYARQAAHLGDASLLEQLERYPAAAPPPGEDK